MVSQVGALGTKYQEWVMLPVDRKLILFGNPILENLTKTPLYMVPLFWIPVLTCFFAYGWKELVMLDASMVIINCVRSF